MGLSLSDILLRDVSAERSDALLVRLGAQALVELPKSNDIVAHFVLDGEVTIEAGKAGDTTLLHAGEFALLHYGTRHSLYPGAHRPAGEGIAIPEWPVGDAPAELRAGTGRDKALLLSAALRLIHRPTSPHEHKPLGPVVRLDPGADDIFRFGMLATDPAQVEAAARGPGASAFVNAFMNLHLTHVMRCAGIALDGAFRDFTQSPYLMTSEKTRSVATAMRLMQTHLERPWTVAGLAREVRLSRSTFAAVFRESVGTGPMAYLARLRMERAAALLTERRLELPLIAIAQWVGYEAPSAFARAFKHHFGLSPRAYCSATREERA